MVISATLDLSDVEKGWGGMVGRASRGSAFFKELVPSVRKELKDHKKQRRGPQGKWQARSIESRKRARRKSKTKRRKGRTAGLLGKLPINYKAKVFGEDLLMINRAQWAGAHNKGATIGNRAKLPPREFAYLTPQFKESIRRQYGAYVAKGYLVN